MIYDGVIEGKTVRLRSIEESDAEITFKMRNDPEKAKYVRPSKGTVEGQREYIKKQRAVPDDYLFIIEDYQGNPIGMKGIYNYDKEKNEIETGRFIGYGSQVQNIEALMLSFDFAFDVLNVDHIVMSALENNKAMIGIQKKFGVKFTYRDHYEGLDYDNLHSVLTREAYSKSRPKVSALINRFARR